MDEINSQTKKTFEDLLGQAAYRGNTEKAFTDKLLGRQDAEKLRDLIRKDDLTRSELLELLYLVCGVELKLVNFDERDRYILGKYYTWIRDLVKLAEFMYDYEIYLNTAESIISAPAKNYSQLSADDALFSKYGDLTAHLDIKEIEYLRVNMKSIKQMTLHNIKFSVDIFLFLTRSTLSLSGVGFDTLSKSRFEYSYGKDNPLMPGQQQKRGFFG